MFVSGRPSRPVAKQSPVPCRSAQYSADPSRSARERPTNNARIFDYSFGSVLDVHPHQKYVPLPSLHESAPLGLGVFANVYDEIIRTQASQERESPTHGGKDSQNIPRRDPWTEIVEETCKVSGSKSAMKSEVGVKSGGAENDANNGGQQWCSESIVTASNHQQISGHADQLAGMNTATAMKDKAGLAASGGAAKIDCATEILADRARCTTRPDTKDADLGSDHGDNNGGVLVAGGRKRPNGELPGDDGAVVSERGTPTASTSSTLGYTWDVLDTCGSESLLSAGGSEEESHREAGRLKGVLPRISDAEMSVSSRSASGTSVGKAIIQEDGDDKNHDVEEMMDCLAGVLLDPDDEEEI